MSCAIPFTRRKRDSYWVGMQWKQYRILFSLFNSRAEYLLCLLLLILYLEDVWMFAFRFALRVSDSEERRWNVASFWEWQKGKMRTLRYCLGKRSPHLMWAAISVHPEMCDLWRVLLCQPSSPLSTLQSHQKMIAVSSAYRSSQWQRWRSQKNGLQLALTCAGKARKTK